MLSKLSRFLTIATLTTLTCIITHPSSAKTVDTRMTTIETSANLTTHKLIAQVYGQDFALDGDESPQLLTGTSFPQNSHAEDGLMVYAIVADCFKQLGEQEPAIRTTDLTNPFNIFPL